MKKIDVDALSPEERERVRRALHPRRKMIFVLLNAGDLSRWRRRLDGRETLTAWIERALNWAVAHPAWAKAAPVGKAKPRHEGLSRRFCEEDVADWHDAVPEGESFTAWVERMLRYAEQQGM